MLYVDCEKNSTPFVLYPRPMHAIRLMGVCRTYHSTGMYIGTIMPAKMKLLYMSVTLLMAMLLIFLTANLHFWTVPQSMRTGSESLQSYGIVGRNATGVRGSNSILASLTTTSSSPSPSPRQSEANPFQGEELAKIKNPLQGEELVRARTSPSRRDIALNSSSSKFERKEMGTTKSSALLQMLTTDKRLTQEFAKLQTPHHSGGYALAHDFWEQLTSASRNLLTLQCWASRLNMSVVEPFVQKSNLHSPTGDKEVKDLLQFSDVYDLDYWNTLSQKVDYSPLTPWERFTERAPRNLITVQLKYGATKQVPQQEGRLYRQGCGSKGSWNRLVQFLQSRHKFTVVRQVCINFAHNKEFSLSEFYEEIFGDNMPSDSTVLFEQWRGLSNARIQVREPGCKKATASSVDAEPSKRVLLDAQEYTEKYLRTSDYVAIFARMEKAKQQKEQEGRVSNCFHETLDRWSKMISETRLNTTFLSADVGRFGSMSLKMAKDDLYGAFAEFFNTIYGNKLTIRKWEATFESISGTSQSGYIGILQKVLASRAKCVLFVGGGSFQRNALQLYRKRHAKQDWCIYIIDNCTEGKYKVQLQHPGRL